MKRINIKCPYCGSRAYLRPSSVVYGDHTDDTEAKLYVCARYPACDAYVAAHRDTLLPMGTLADKNLRFLRRFLSASVPMGSRVSLWAAT